MTIRSVAVIGAGVMGSGIAAQIANAGVPVQLLDIVPGAAETALARLAKAEPAAFMDRSAAKLITPGGLEAALDQADWIIEAITEQPDAKSALYRQIEAKRRPGSIVSSNTSTLPLARLIADQPDSFRRDFLISHFFNPPRYMRLLELVAGPDTRDDAVAAITTFADLALGKGVVRAKDTPGFIANRIGTYWLQAAVNAAFDLGVSVEEADATLSRPFGVPKTGVFGLLDLVGLDLMPLVGRSLCATLPASDDFQRLHREPELLRRLIADGFTGRKGKGGFYRLENRQKLALDLVSGQYRPARRIEAPKLDAAALLRTNSAAGAYVRAVMVPLLGYAAGLVPEIADDLAAIDQAMRLGYHWRYGPFELIDRIGPAWLVEELRRQDRPVPPLLTAAGSSCYRQHDQALWQITPTGTEAPVSTPPGILSLAAIKRQGPPLLNNAAASLWDLGDGVACFEITTKMNALDGDVLALLGQSLTHVGQRMRALILYSDGENFSVGANLGQLLFATNIALWPVIDGLIRAGQDTLLAMKYAPFPVVGAPAGLALGGGCEMLLHCDAIQAHAETYSGLVEMGVGLVPGWGGNKELLARWFAAPHQPNGPMPAIAKVFETISLATVSKSAAEARRLGILRPGDGITMNRDRLLADAKAKALALAQAGYTPPAPPSFRLPGASGRAALAMAVEALRQQGKATAHDAIVALALADILTGGADADITQPVTEQALLDLERRHFLHLLRQPATLARLEHMLETGKPLRN